MKDLVKGFLSDAEKARIVESVNRAEKQTIGEIVPMIVSSSGHYPLSGVLGGLALSVPLALLAAYFVAPLARFPMRDMWVFLGIEILLFTLCYLLAAHVPWIKRHFIPAAEMADQVRTAAIAGFYLNGLYRTKHETGVLVYISIFERRVWVLGDRGINEKVGEDAWAGIVDMITAGIRDRRPAEAICGAVDRAGEILRKHFPITPDDTDELPNLIQGK
jgi:putative membrane protein